MAARRGRPPLDPVDRALWEAVAATVTPLRQRRRRIVAKPAELPLAEPPKPAPTEAPKPDAAAAPAKPAPARGRPVAPPPKPAPGDIDRRTRLRIARGHTAVEARIDLHGLTQARAHAVLLGFLASKQAEGLKTVLVITGKGRNVDDAGPIPVKQGVLKRQVPHWLHSAPLKPLVLQVSEAHLKHGGSGAYYVYLRRVR